MLFNVCRQQYIPNPIANPEMTLLDMYAEWMQASVYLARSGKGSSKRVKARSVHAPARRLARTTISLGPDEGIAFGLRAVRYSLALHPLLSTQSMHS